MRERQISYNITYMWNLKYDTNQHIYETKTDSQIQRIDFVVAKQGWIRGGKEWDQQSSTIIYRMDKQQGPTAQHRQLYAVSCEKL